MKIRVLQSVFSFELIALVARVSPGHEDVVVADAT
jgi:hypothetical protein